MSIDVKDHVTAGPCRFVRARAGNLWYVTALGFEFPVPFSEMGEATFDAEVKGLHMMRYVRLHAATMAEAGLQRTA